MKKSELCAIVRDGEVLYEGSFYFIGRFADRYGMRQRALARIRRNEIPKPTKPRNTRTWLYSSWDDFVSTMYRDELDRSSKVR